MIMCEFIIGMIVAFACILFGWCLGESDGRENAEKRIKRKLKSLYSVDVCKEMEEHFYD